MKLLATSLAVALASAPLAAAAPKADSPQTQAAAVSAPSTERLELARQFIASTAPADSLIEAWRAGYWHAASQGIEDEGERAGAKDHLNRLFARLEPHIRQAMPNVLEIYALLYAREFSADDLRHMIAFAETPVGKRYLLRSALLDSDPSLMEAQSELMESLTPVMEEFGREMCRKRAAERFAAGDTKAKCPLTAGTESQAG